MPVLKDLALDQPIPADVLPTPLAAIVPKLNPDGTVKPIALPTPLAAIVPKLNPDGSIADPAVIVPILPAIVPLILAGAPLLAPLAVANTETVIVSYVCTANELAVGTTFLIKAYCIRTGATSAAPVIRVRVGTTTLTGNIAASLTVVANSVQVPNAIDGLVTVRMAGASGTVIGSLTNLIHIGAASFNPTIGVIASPVAVNTTAVIRVELTCISGSVNNTYTFHEALISKIRA